MSTEKWGIGHSQTMILDQERREIVRCGKQWDEEKNIGFCVFVCALASVCVCVPTNNIKLIDRSNVQNGYYSYTRKNALQTIHTHKNNTNYYPLNWNCWDAFELDWNCCYFAWSTRNAKLHMKWFSYSHKMHFHWLPSHLKSSITVYTT